MFEKLMQAAEQLATGVSRRQFLGRLGRAALAAAAVVGGAAAMAGEARAGGGCPQGTHRVSCFVRSPSTICCPAGKRCSCNHTGCGCV